MSITCSPVQSMAQCIRWCKNSAIAVTVMNNNEVRYCTQHWYPAVKGNPKLDIHIGLPSVRPTHILGQDLLGGGSGCPPSQCFPNKIN